jgi:hypothetical protein
VTGEVLAQDGSHVERREALWSDDCRSASFFHLGQKSRDRIILRDLQVNPIPGVSPLKDS